MTDKQKFTFLLRADERETLRRLAELADRSEGAMIRKLIREAGRGLPLTPSNELPEKGEGKYETR